MAIPFPSPEGMATWVTPLFYGSWLLVAIAIGAATRSYQLRSAINRTSAAPAVAGPVPSTA